MPRAPEDDERNARNQGNEAQAGQKVADWLREQGATFISEKRIAGAGTPRVMDHMIYQPYPFALEILWRDDINAHHRAKRLLGLRVAMAEVLGPHIPLVVAAIGGRELPPNAAVNSRSDMPFVDAVLDVGALPSLSELEPFLLLDAATQEILQNGNPRDVAELDLSALHKAWEQTLSVHSIVTKKSWPKQTLAARIQQAYETEFVQLAPEQQDATDDVVKRFTRHYLFKQSLHDWIVAQVGGHFEEERVEVQSAGETVRMPLRFWVSPRGRRVLFKTVSRADHFLLNRIPELLAEAWIARSRRCNAADSCLLLVIPTGFDSGLPTTQFLSSAMTRLYNAGWIVCPFDAAEAEPTFLRDLRTMDGEQ